MDHELRKGICILNCNKDHIHGIVLLEEIYTDGPVRFRVFVRGISPGLHGFHIHRRGNDLSGPDGLCEHFNPTNQPHGDLNSKNSHVGDLGNLKAFQAELLDKDDNPIDVTGIINTEFVANRVRLSGPNSVFGRSLVIHEDEDDLGKGSHEDSLKTGHSGKRILWGIIGVNDGEDCESNISLPPINYL